MGCEVKQPERGARVTMRKVFDDEFLPAGGNGEERGGFHFFLRNRQLIVPFPIETTLINVSIERQVERGLMHVAAHDRDDQTEFAELFHLALLVFPPGPFWQTSPEVVPDDF